MLGKHIFTILIALFFNLFLTTAIAAPAKNKATNSKQAPIQSPAPAAPTLNSLEKALDLNVGTKAAYNDFVDDGGLSKQDNWHGLQIGSFQSGRGEDGLISYIIATVNRYSSASLKDVRNTLSQYCGFKDEDWVRQDMMGNVGGKALNEKCKADYENWTAGRGIISFTISKP